MSIRRHSPRHFITIFITTSVALSVLSLLSVPREARLLRGFISEAHAQDDFFDDSDFEDFDDFENPVPHYTVPPLPEASSNPSAHATEPTTTREETPIRTQQYSPSVELRSAQIPGAQGGLDVGTDEPRAAAPRNRPRKAVSLVNRSGVSLSSDTRDSSDGISLVRWKSSTITEKAARELLQRQGISMSVSALGAVSFSRSAPSPTASGSKNAAPDLYLRFAGDIYPGLKMGDHQGLVFSGALSSAHGKRAKISFYRIDFESTRLGALASQDTKTFKASIDALASTLRKENQQRLGWAPESAGVHFWLAQQIADIAARKDYLRLRVEGIATQLQGSPRVSDLIANLRDSDAKLKSPKPPTAARDSARRLIERLAQLDRTVTPEYLASFDALFTRHYQSTIRVLQAMDHHSLRFDILRNASESRARAARLMAAGFTQAEAAMTVDFATFVWMAPDSGLIDAFEINSLRTLARQATATFEHAAGESFRKLKPHHSSVNRLGGTVALKDILQDATGFLFDKNANVVRSRTSPSVRMDVDAYQVRGKIEQLIRARAASKSLVLDWDAVDAMARELLLALARTST